MMSLHCWCSSASFSFQSNAMVLRFVLTTTCICVCVRCVYADVQRQQWEAAFVALVQDAAMQLEQERMRTLYFARRGCRFGFPHLRIQKTRLRTSRDCVFMTRGDRDILWRRRRDEDCWINAYSPGLLLLWNGNMDIQPICHTEESMSAVHYILQYACKPETVHDLRTTFASLAASSAAYRSKLWTLATRYVKAHFVGKMVRTVHCISFHSGRRLTAVGMLRRPDRKRRCCCIRICRS
jgi:hypothetical protein